MTRILPSGYNKWAVSAPPLRISAFLRVVLNVWNVKCASVLSSDVDAVAGVSIPCSRAVAGNVGVCFRRRARGSRQTSGADARQVRDRESAQPVSLNPAIHMEATIR